MICRKCGMPNHSENKFCENCGEKLEDNKLKVIPKRRLPKMGIILIIGVVLIVSGIVRGEMYKKTIVKEDLVNEETNEIINNDSENYETEEVHETEIQKTLDYYRFNETVLIGYGFEMILKPDGTIIARGRNSNGELGNGRLTDTEEWVPVEGISNVVQIACAGNKTECTVYALKKDGTLWYWGAEQVKPVKVEGIDNIKQLTFKNAGHSDTMGYHGFVYAHNNEGQIIGLYGSDHSEIFDGIKMDDFEQIIYSGSSTNVYILDGKLYEYKDGDSIQIGTQDNYVDIYEYGGRCGLIDEMGEVYNYNGRTNEIKSKGGKNCKKVYQILDDRYTYELSFHYIDGLDSGGYLAARGDNRYGEVGNGTREDYDEWWNIEVPSIQDAYSSLNGKAFAIDKENNLWAWGADYSNYPEIQYNIDEVVNNN